MNKEEYLKLYKKLRKIEKLLLKQELTTLSLKKAVRYTGFSKSHLYKLTHGQRIPHYKPQGKMVYFLKNDLDDFLISNRIATKEEIAEKAKEYLKIKK